MKYLNCVLQLFYSIVFLTHNIFQLLVFADFLIFFFFRNFLLHIIFSFFLHKCFDFAMSHLQHSLYDVWSSSDYMFDIIFAYLIIKLFENLFFISKKVLFKVFQFASLFAADVEAT